MDVIRHHNVRMQDEIPAIRPVTNRPLDATRDPRIVQPSGPRSGAVEFKIGRQELLSRLFLESIEPPHKSARQRSAQAPRQKYGTPIRLPMRQVALVISG